MSESDDPTQPQRLYTTRDVETAVWRSNIQTRVDDVLRVVSPLQGLPGKIDAISADLSEVSALTLEHRVILRGEKNDNGLVAKVNAQGKEIGELKKTLGWILGAIGGPLLALLLALLWGIFTGRVSLVFQ